MVKIHHIIRIIFSAVGARTIFQSARKFPACFDWTIVFIQVLLLVLSVVILGQNLSAIFTVTVSDVSRFVTKIKSFQRFCDLAFRAGFLQIRHSGTNLSQNKKDCCKNSLSKGIHPAWFEHATFWFVARHSIQLSYGCIRRMFRLQMLRNRVKFGSRIYLAK